MSTHRIQLVSDRSGRRSDEAPPTRVRLGELLSASGKISQRHLRKYLDAQRGMAVHLGELLCAERAVEPRDILAALRLQWSAGTIDLATEPPDPDLVERLGLNGCLDRRLLPWRRIGGATVIAAVYPETFERARPELEQLFGPVMLALVLAEDMERCLARLMPEQLNRRAETRLAHDVSCRVWSGPALPRAAGAAAALGAVVLAVAPLAALLGLTVLAMTLLVLMTAFKLAAALCSRQPPEKPVTLRAARVVPLPAPSDSRLPVVSLLVPVFRETGVIGPLVRRLSALDYPGALLDICLIAEADDIRTIDALLAAGLPRTMRVIVVPCGSVRTKPRALNYALDFCRGEIVGVYDAEDDPEPDQIHRVVSRFARSGPDLACLQGRLAYYNAGQNLLSRCFAVEYATWFSVMLPGLARLGLPVPLGGTTLFFRYSLLKRLDAWDAHNVTEDADLGLRVARAGLRTELIDTTTREEANCRLWPWVRQRSRWIKGYAMTYATHMRRPGRLRADLGWRGWAGVQLLFLGTLLQALLAPLLWLWWLVPLGLGHPLAPLLPVWAVWLCSGLLVASEAVNLGIGALALRRTGQTRLLPALVLMNPYSMLATCAALKALAEMLRRPFFWDKTEHGLTTMPAGAPATP